MLLHQQCSTMHWPVLLTLKNLKISVFFFYFYYDCLHSSTIMLCMVTSVIVVTNTLYGSGSIMPLIYQIMCHLFMNKWKPEVNWMRCCVYWLPQYRLSKFGCYTRYLDWQPSRPVCVSWGWQWPTSKVCCHASCVCVCVASWPQLLMNLSHLTAEGTSTN